MACYGYSETAPHLLLRQQGLSMCWPECSCSLSHKLQDHSWFQTKLTCTHAVCLLSRNFMLRATQILPHTRYSDSEARAYASLSAHARHNMKFKLTAGSTLEVTLSQFWSSLGEGLLDVDVAFHGVEIKGTGVIPGPTRTAKVHIRCAAAASYIVLMGTCRAATALV